MKNIFDRLSLLDAHYHATQEERFYEAVRFANEQFHLIDYGRHRVTFDMGDGYVLKIPHCSVGETANWEEAEIYAIHADHCDNIYARCELIEWGNVHALKMEKVKTKGVHNRPLPNWVDHIDCGQVGYTVDGRLVAYDFSHV